eukprot:3387517-Prymnesium_polylepis.1
MIAYWELHPLSPDRVPCGRALCSVLGVGVSGTVQYTRRIRCELNPRFARSHSLHTNSGGHIHFRPTAAHSHIPSVSRNMFT